jgi:DHA1 family multidrug resistance protein-like MFS transporter
MDLFRETAVGQLIRFVTRNKVLLYAEEKEGFRWAPLVKLYSKVVLFS